MRLSELLATAYETVPIGAAKTARPYSLLVIGDLATQYMELVDNRDGVAYAVICAAMYGRDGIDRIGVTLIDGPSEMHGSIGRLNPFDPMQWDCFNYTFEADDVEIGVLP